MSGCKLFLGGWFVCSWPSGVTWVGGLWAVLSSIGNTGVWLSEMYISRVSVVFDLVRNSTRGISLESTDFLLTFVDRFIATFGIESESAPKNFAGKVHDWLKKKKTFLIVNLFLHFNRMDARSRNAQRRIFIHFVINHRPENIRVILSFSTEMYTRNVFICIFIHFACELVWNVSVNQKRFPYTTVKSILQQQKFSRNNSFVFNFSWTQRFDWNHIE